MLSEPQSSFSISCVFCTAFLTQQIQPYVPPSTAEHFSSTTTKIVTELSEKPSAFVASTNGDVKLSYQV